MKNKLLAALMLCVFSIGAIAADSTYMIEDLYAKNIELQGTKVIVTGKVIKVSSAIMGKDWVQIQDTSKNPEMNKVFFTGPMDKSGVNIGDNVTATGTLKINVDLGSGYFYKVLVEDSTFKKLHK
ncbi:MAG: opacity protein-like surface antigen [Sulfurimonas sp.]|jgi:opacity protein-like surface antigen